MWVNLVIPPHPKPDGLQKQLIPIRWAVLSRQSSKVSDNNFDDFKKVDKPCHQLDGNSQLRHYGKDAVEDKAQTKAKLEQTIRRAMLAPWAISTIETTSKKDDLMSQSEDALCVICMERFADLELLPCRHDRFCGQCVLEAVCSWTRPEAPSCPLCRSPFHTMVLLN